ncbi:MAG TPA: MCM family protein [Methanoregulaceae archaeon]|nr:MCM family protein [Methanoregulaceae archaeon]
MATEEHETTNRVGDWSRFLKNRYRNQLGELLRQYPRKRSLYIDFRDVYAFGKVGVRMAEELLENPGKVIEDVRDAVKSQQLARGRSAQEPGINIRFTNLPQRIQAREIRSEHINRFVSVEGILRKATEVRPRIVEAVFRCPGGHLTRKVQEYGQFVEPDGCATEGCTYRKLILLPKRSSFVDAQKLRIQESPEGLRGGEQPQTLDVDVTDDIAGIVAPGDRVVINGILRSQQRVTHGTKSTVFDIYLQANSIEVAEKEFEEVSISEEDEAEINRLSSDPEIYHKITHSIAPTIYGNAEVKEAIALQLFGGITKTMPDGSHLRGDIHCLLIGDPGIAKSQLLRYVVKLSPRGIYTSGQSSTQAGLTATAVKDEFGDGRWTLEAGALVLADMGIAAVDEMDKMQKEDRSALHEAMEQQCYDAETEILTERGWIPFPELRPDDRVATLSPEGELEYARPTRLFAGEYDGDLYYVKSPALDLAVTPNHSIYVDLCRHDDQWEGFALRRMDGVPTDARMRFRKHAMWKGEHREHHEIPSADGPIRVPMDEWLALLGYYLSRGALRVSPGTGLADRVLITPAPGEAVDPIRACLERLPFPFTWDGHTLEIHSEAVAHHLALLGKDDRTGIPEYTRRLPPGQLRVFLDALVPKGGPVDPGTGSVLFRTPSRRLADDLTEVLLKAGWSGDRSSLVTTDGPQDRSGEGTWQVRFNRGNENEPDVNARGRREIERHPYRGRIYCVEVPHHVVYVRRNGIPVWCGNSISVAKAGITATLKSRCALLGAANPKLGRFDEYADIGEQINMPPSLLSRFDLIFILTDKPDHKRDEAIAEHILKSHGIGELIAQHARQPIEGVDDEYIRRELAPVTPEIDPSMLRKYVAYAKRTCFPIMSPEAKQVLVNYYMRLRDLADTNKPVPVTARQLEALVRLAEASARIRLARRIEAPDAERVVRIVDTCLRQVAYDPKTGTFDIDRVATGISKGKRDLIRAIKEAIRENADITGRAQIAQVVDLLAQQGYAREEIRKQIEHFLRSGEAMEPKNGVIKLI